MGQVIIAAKGAWQELIDVVRASASPSAGTAATTNQRINHH